MVGTALLAAASPSAAGPKGLEALAIDVSIWWWVGVTAVIIVALLADLFLFHRDAHEVSIREAAWSSTAWIILGLAFGGVMWWQFGGQPAAEYYAGYIIEKSLSVDNIFVFAVIFTYFAVPKHLQHRLLFWGIFGALIFRAIFIALGAAILDRFDWAFVLFGAFLIFTGIKLAVREDEHDVGSNPILKWMRKHIAMTDTYEGQKFWVRRAGKRVATPMVAVLLVIESSDILFAVDSIPAVFAVTKTPFIVFTSNAFAILGLRALYFLLAGAMSKFHYLRYGLAAVLIFVGVKMSVTLWYHLPTWISLIVISVLIASSIVISLRRAPEEEPHPELLGGHPDEPHHHEGGH
jgi:tellurite resistance protein TerC